MVYNSEKYLQEQIDKNKEQLKNLKIDIIKEKLFYRVSNNNIDYNEYLFICESLDKNKNNLNIY